MCILNLMVDALINVTLIEGGKYHVLVFCNVTQRYAKKEKPWEYRQRLE